MWEEAQLGKELVGRLTIDMPHDMPQTGPTEMPTDSSGNHCA